MWGLCQYIHCRIWGFCPYIQSCEASAHTFSVCEASAHTFIQPGLNKIQILILIITKSRNPKFRVLIIMCFASSPPKIGGYLLKGACLGGGGGLWAGGRVRFPSHLVQEVWFGCSAEVMIIVRGWEVGKGVGSWPGWDGGGVGRGGERGRYIDNWRFKLSGGERNRAKLLLIDIKITWKGEVI